MRLSMCSRKTAVMLGVVAAGCWSGASQASIISATTDADFASSPYTLQLADDAAAYTFSATGDPVQPSAIRTDGAARIGTDAGTVATYGTGSLAPFIGPNLSATFDRYDSATPFYSPGSEAYLALGLDLDDGLHYGYARVDTNANTLLGYGYQSVAGAGIRAGDVAAGSNPVPEPSSLALFGLGLFGLAGGAAARGRRYARRSS